MKILQITLGMLCAFATVPAFAGISSTPVPEPVSMTLLAIGVGGAAVVRGLRSRRK